MTQVYSKKDVVAELEDLVFRLSTQKVLAQKIGISEAYLSDVIHGRREPGNKILSFLGYEKVVCYREVKK